MNKLINNFIQLPTYLKVIIGLSLILFIISLTQPAFYIDRENNPNAYSNSLVLFLLGWMSFLGGAIIPFIIWLANPLYFLSLFLILKNKSLAVYAALSSTCLALLFSLLNSIITSESGSSSLITGRGLGFKLWFTSFGLLTFGLLLNQILTQKRKIPNRVR